MYSTPKNVPRPNTRTRQVYDLLVDRTQRGTTLRWRDAHAAYCAYSNPDTGLQPLSREQRIRANLVVSAILNKYGERITRGQYALRKDAPRTQAPPATSTLTVGQLAEQLKCFGATLPVILDTEGRASPLSDESQLSVGLLPTGWALVITAK